MSLLFCTLLLLENPSYDVNKKLLRYVKCIKNRKTSTKNKNDATRNN